MYDMSRAGPCPFCGAAMAVIQFTGDAFQAKCTCGARGPRKESRQEAAAAWESRAETKPAPRVRSRT